MIEVEVLVPVSSSVESCLSFYYGKNASKNNSKEDVGDQVRQVRLLLGNLVLPINASGFGKRTSQSCESNMILRRGQRVADVVMLEMAMEVMVMTLCPYTASWKVIMMMVKKRTLRLLAANFEVTAVTLLRKIRTSCALMSATRKA